MIDKDKIRVGLKFSYLEVPKYEITKIDNGLFWTNDLNKSDVTEDGLWTLNALTDNNSPALIIEVPPETPEQKGIREIAYADKVIVDIEQFELDNIEYLSNKIIEKIDRIR